MSKKHAVLSASGSHRWMNCPGSVRLEQQIPQKPSSAAADWGTRAHDFSEAVLNGQMDLYEIPAEFHDVVEMYTKYVTAHVQPESVLWVEKSFDLGKIHDDMFGTCDAVVITGNTMHVIDLKSGIGKVEAQDNTQLMYYALGALLEVPNKSAIEQVAMHIVQPKLGAVDKWEVSVDHIYAWAQELKAAAVATEKHNAPVIPGEQCQWCRAKAICPAKWAIANEAAGLDFTEPTFNLEHALDLAEQLKPWVEAVQELAKDKLQAGQSVIGWQLKPGKKTRKWIDAKVAENRFKMVPDAWTAPALKSPTQVEKALGKDLLEGLIDYSEAAPSLARSDF